MKLAAHLALLLASTAAHNGWSQTSVPWTDDFESYSLGIDPTMPSAGGWEPFANWPGLVGARISNTVASSGSQSLFNGGNSDLVQIFDVSSGRWVMSTRIYVPTTGPEAMAQDTWFIMLHQYSHVGPKDWALQLDFDPLATTVTYSLGPNDGVSMPFTPDKWVDIDVDVDIAVDQATCFIDGVQFGAPFQWSQGTVPSSNPPRIQALDLFSNFQNQSGNPAGGASYDDFSLLPSDITRFCSAKTTLFCGAPTVTAVGIPSVNATSGFTIAAAPARACRQGLMLYSSQAPVPGAPFAGPGNGRLCLSPMGLRRAGPIDSGGTSPAQCDGVMALDWNAFASNNWVSAGCSPVPGQTNPAGFLNTAGTAVSVQVWGRDSVQTGQLLSAGIGFITGP